MTRVPTRQPLPERGRTAGQGLLTIADQGVVSLTNFLTGVVVARRASPPELGLYALAFGIVLFWTNAQTAIVSTPYNVYCMRLPEQERGAYTAGTFVHHLCIAASATVALALGALAVARTGAVPGLAPVLGVLAVTLPLALAREYFRQLSFSRLRVGTAMLSDLVVAAVQLAALLALARAGRVSARTACAAAGLAALAALAVWVPRSAALLELPRRRVAEAFRTNWVTGRWALASAAVTVGGAQLYPWFTATTRGAGEAGLLAACLGITAFTNPLLIGMGNFLAPRIMHAYAAGGIGAVQRVTRGGLAAIAALMALAAPALVLGGGTLLRLVYGDRFAGQGATVALLVAAVAVDWLSLPAHYALLLLDRAALVVKANLILLAVTATVGFAAVAARGPVGAGAGLLLGNALSTSFKWWEHRKRVADLERGPRIAPAALREART